MVNDLKDALSIFLQIPDWRSLVHEEDCTDKLSDDLHPDDRTCKCDGLHNIKLIESVAKRAGLRMWPESLHKEKL